MNKKILAITGIGMILTTKLCFAQNQQVSTSIDRYLLVANEPLVSQVDLLQQTFEIRFPSKVHTIHDAINYLLQFSGYRLADNRFMSVEVKAMLSQPLPIVDRVFGPMTLQKGLETLAGEQFQLLIDPIHREISFRLKKSYLKLYQSSNKSFLGNM